ncbi:MAG: dihydroorotase [Gammaproteobacteria bacterium]
MTTLTITAPDDMHVHFRDDDALAITVPATARTFARAIVMPNLRPAVTTVKQALAYRDRILRHVPTKSNFTPLMTLYMNPSLTVEDIKNTMGAGIIGVKLYPQGATTHAEQGVANLSEIYPVLDAMQKIGLPLLIHGEAVGHDIDIFDRERFFIENTLMPLRQQFPALKIVLEHITTQDAVDFVKSVRDGLAATITPHHLKYNRNAMLEGGIKPHLYCMPILKREHHREALVAAATSGDPRFFLGTDSAPHARLTKETTCGCAGVFSAPQAMAWYASIFETAGALDKLEGFASHFGADFYGLPRNQGTLTLTKKMQTIPASMTWIKGDTLVPMGAGEDIGWVAL